LDANAHIETPLKTALQESRTSIKCFQRPSGWHFKLLRLGSGCHLSLQKQDCTNLSFSIHKRSM